MNSQQIKRIINTKLRFHFPRGFNLSPPVLQLFLGGEWKSSFSIVNFPSFFSPETPAEYSYEISLHDEFGIRKRTQTVRLSPFGSSNIEPGLWGGCDNIRLGMVSFQIKPESIFFRADRHLGVIKPQIFAYYQNLSNRALGLIHPQTSLIKKSLGSVNWTSNQVVDLAVTKTINLFQINPSHQKYQATLAIKCIETSETIEEKQVSIPPLGATCSQFNFSDNGSKVYVSASQLPGPNAKPIIFVTQKTGAIFASHT